MEVQIEGERYEKVDGKALDLMRKMLEVDFVERIGAEEGLEHSFFSQKGEEKEKEGGTMSVTEMCSFDLYEF